MRAPVVATALLLTLHLPATGEVGLLVIDLEGDGLRLSDAYYPVSFDTDGDGGAELTSWTAQAQNEAFLWLDLDNDGRVDHGGELVGSAMAIPGGGPDDDAFAALRALDRISLGGNDDGMLSAGDRAWRELRLWVDSDHDGESDPPEIFEPGDWGLRAISLAFETAFDLDGGLNLLRRRARIELSRSSTRGAGRQIRAITLTEVFFDQAPSDDPPPPTRTYRLAVTPPF